VVFNRQETQFRSRAAAKAHILRFVRPGFHLPAREDS
jgi:hypothetical protein